MHSESCRPLPAVDHDLTFGEAPPLSAAPSKMSTLERNNQKWNEHKDEIRRVYVDEDKTLRETMQLIEQDWGFKSSERKWKMKIKEWNFDKNIPAREMNFMVEKAEKRKLNEGKTTIFLRGGIEVPKEKFDQHKRRKVVREVTEPIVETPPNVTYHTPRADFLVSHWSSDGSHDSAYFSETPLPKSASAVLSATDSNEQHVSSQTDEDIRKSPEGIFEPTVQFNTVSTNTSQLIPDESDDVEILGSIRESKKSLDSGENPNMAAADRQDAPTVNFSNSNKTSLISSTHSLNLKAARNFLSEGRLLNSADLFLTILFESFDVLENNFVTTSLDKETFEECMAGVLCYIENKQRRPYLQDNLDNQDTRITFQRVFESIEVRFSPQCRLCAATPKLEFTFCGLLNYQEGKRNVATHRICEALIDSFTGHKLGPTKCRIILAMVLLDRGFHGDSLQEFVRAAAIYLKSDKPGVNALRALRQASRKSPFRKELSKVASEAYKEAQRADERARSTEQYPFIRSDVQFSYTIMKLVIQCLRMDWWTCGIELLESMLQNLGECIYSHQRRNWIELYLQLFQLCYKYEDYNQATSAISTAYRITDMILPCRRVARGRGLIMDLPWHRSWIKIARQEFYDNLHTNTVQQITEINSRLGNDDGEAWRSVEALETLKEYSEDEGWEEKSEGNSEDEENEDDARAMKAAEFGLSYTESMSPSLSMDYSALYPRGLKSENAVSIKVEPSVAG